MKKSTWIAIASVAALGVAGYFLFKSWNKKQEEKKRRLLGENKVPGLDPSAGQGTTPKELETNPVGVLTGGLGTSFDVMTSSIANYLKNFNQYQVVTQTSNLNIREKPDGNSKVIGSLAKGSTITAKASGTKGWFAITDDGQTIKGYVSQTFLKALPKSK
jgi:uncharacterized protein YgiM (DUF1202 family)